jgi:hypothetical protein
VRDVFSTPLWLVALAVAAVAPLCVRALQTVLELQLRRRTEEIIARARSAPGDRGSMEEIQREEG